MWTSDATMGQQRFWGKVDAMAQAGLVGLKAGTRGPGLLGGWDGHPTRLWATKQLTELVISHGLTKESYWADWRLLKSVQEQHRRVAAQDILVLRAIKENSRLEVPRDQQDVAAAMRSGVLALNEHVAGSAVTGCRAPVFQRKFRHCLRLGGRLYAVGDDTVQTIPRAERRHMTIDGHSVAEVDLSASFLSIALALTGTNKLPDGDLYALGDFDRHVVKMFMTQTFGGGRLVSKWNRKVDQSIRDVSPAAIRKAAAARYGFLQDLRAIVPSDLLATVPSRHQDWAIGQFLTFIESEIVGAAISSLRGQDILALPLHDALIVARPHARAAKAELSDAFKSRLGLTPHIKVDSATHGDAVELAEDDDGDA